MLAVVEAAPAQSAADESNVNGDASHRLASMAVVRDGHFYPSDPPGDEAESAGQRAQDAPSWWTRGCPAEEPVSSLRLHLPARSGEVEAATKHNVARRPFYRVTSLGV